MGFLAITVLQSGVQAIETTDHLPSNTYRLLGDAHCSVARTAGLCGLGYAQFCASRVHPCSRAHYGCRQRFFHRLPILQSAAAGACVQEAGHVRLRILRQGSQHRVMLRRENRSNRIEL